MAKKRRPKWTTNVARAMRKSCPPNCPAKYSGIERDAEGNITRTFSCKDHCPIGKLKNF